MNNVPIYKAAMDPIECNLDLIHSGRFNSVGRPHAILTMGSSGCGKSFTLKSFSKYLNYLIIDYDEMALQLPELEYNRENHIYDSGLYHAHYDSISAYTERLFRDIITGPRLNVVCHSVIPHEKRIQRLVDAGYDVTILYKPDPRDMVARRKQRLLDTYLYTKIQNVTREEVSALRMHREIHDMEQWIVAHNSH
jgi:ABC-type dipeptide/oligopeptide/nickel transport system ATPase component